MRIGFGYDSHRFEDGRRLVLGGVTIPGATGLKGHSDADVLIHAIIDALLGAAARGDIGSHFPDTDARWKDADSAQLLAAVVEEIAAAGYRIGNVDATVICERPKLRPHIDAIRARLAELLGVDVNQVSVKGKTNEKMDAVGAGVGIVVHAVALLDGPSARGSVG
jgi:2-C-methyl-D-erythritol 2,4-cyclodiphosphate synthase